ncbi:type II toxin-antitoxin system RelE/ParE family toxin [Bradyrhizobium sp. USDA 377]
MNDLLRAIKPTVFVGSSKRDLRAFPAAVRSEIGQSLFEAQLDEHPRNAKPLKGFSGVLEIRDNFDGDTYRTVYATRLDGRPIRPARAPEKIHQRNSHTATPHRPDQAALGRCRGYP